MKIQKWIAVDFDKTLNVYNTGDDLTKLGEPIIPMVNRVKKWLSDGKEVKIFTARVSPQIGLEAEKQIKLIQNWLVQQGLPKLEVTCIKDHGIVEIYDDKAINVKPNKGNFSIGNLKKYTTEELKEVSKEIIEELKRRK